MEERYASKNISEKDLGPSDLTIKRILAFSKALNTSKEMLKEDKKENS